MTTETQSFYLVHRDILPTAIIKTAEAKSLLVRGEAKTINEAVAKVGISRSSFYKYKDKIIPFNEAAYQKIITISLILMHEPGVLSRVLTFIAEEGGNVLTINQSIPLQGMANVVLSVDTNEFRKTVEEFMSLLETIQGVKQAIIVGQS